MERVCSSGVTGFRQGFREVGHEPEAVDATGVVKRDQRVVGQPIKRGRLGLVVERWIDRGRPRCSRNHERPAAMAAAGRGYANPQPAAGGRQRRRHPNDRHRRHDRVTPRIDPRHAARILIRDPHRSRGRGHRARAAPDRDRGADHEASRINP
jgi:hypothetical protein